MAEAKAIRTVRKAIDAVSDDDEEALVSLLDPEVEWRPTAFLTGEGSFTGTDGVRRWLAEMRELRGRGTEVLTFAADFEQLDDGRVLVLGHGKLQRDLGPLEQELGWIWEFGEDGRITAMTNYLSQAEARRAAGADGE